MHQCVDRGEGPAEYLVHRLKAGTYLLTDTILVFQRDDVAISGTVNWFGLRQTTLKLDAGLKNTQGAHVLQYFHFNVIASNSIAIRSLNLDGGAPTLTAQRGIAVCPLGGQQLQGFEFKNLEERNYKSFFTLIGNSHTEHLQTTFLKQTPASPGEARLRDFLLTQLTAENRFCMGTVRNVLFENNSLFMQNVGFYVIPYTAKTTHDIVLTTPGVAAVPGSRDWLEVERTEVAGKQSGIVVRGNTFKADLPAGASRPAQEQETHSGLKVHSVSGMLIQGNTFDAGTMPYTFGGGAMINLAAGNYDTRVTGNSFKFPANHAYPQNGVYINAGHATHYMYGIGTIGLFSADLKTKVEGNYFFNAKVRVWDACANEPGKAVTTAFCNDMSSVPGAVKADGISIKGNLLWNAAGQLQGSSDLGVTWKVCTNEAAWVALKNAETPGILYCRAAIDLTH